AVRPSPICSTTARTTDESGKHKTIVRHAAAIAAGEVAAANGGRRWGLRSKASSLWPAASIRSARAVPSNPAPIRPMGEGDKGYFSCSEDNETFSVELRPSL